MKGILIFNRLNEVLFAKCNRKFANYVQELALQQGLCRKIPEGENKLCAKVLTQLFGPIITSQHVMASQFGNIYLSIKCKDGKNIVFDEYMSYIFMYISNEDIEFMKKLLAISITIVRYLCGPNVSLLKTDVQKVQLVSNLIDSWRELRENEQSILTEAVEQLTLNPSLASGVLKILSDTANKLKSQFELNNVHFLILIKHKFLSLFSSKTAQDLLASDVLLIVIMSHLFNQRFIKTDCDILLFEENCLENSNSRNVDKAQSCQFLNNHSSLCETVLLGSRDDGFTFNNIYISEINHDINLVAIVEASNVTVTTALHESSHNLNVINELQLPRDIDEMKPNFDSLDAAAKKLIDGLKKGKSAATNELDSCQKKLQIKRENLRKKLNEFFKSRDPETISQVEAEISEFSENLREMLQFLSLEKNIFRQNRNVIITVQSIRKNLMDMGDFFKTKVGRDVLNESKEIQAMNKYLEEFPGLVHFIYIDRTTHRLSAPMIEFSNQDTLNLTKKKVWSMVEQSRIHLQEGHLTAMWKDTTFHYCYNVWFEDNSGTPLKCKMYPNQMLQNFPQPGIICGDYYKKLAETYFPKLLPNKLRVCELYCVHLGLATSSCILEHTRRLAATIWEITGVHNSPADLL